MVKGAGSTPAPRILKKSKIKSVLRRREKIMVLNIDGIQFEFVIEDYRPSTREHWDDEWCVITASAIGGGLNYSIRSSCMCCCEVEWLYNKLKELADGIMTEETEISFVEPDFEYKLYPNNQGAYYVEWTFNLWNEGVLTNNWFTLTFIDEEILEIIKYLKTVIEEQLKK